MYLVGEGNLSGVGLHLENPKTAGTGGLKHSHKRRSRSLLALLALLEPSRRPLLICKRGVEKM